jgi:Uncharacterized conserved protein
MTEFVTPKQIRQQARIGAFTGQTSGMCPGYTQANLVILPKKEAYDFLYLHNEIPNPVRFWKLRMRDLNDFKRSHRMLIWQRIFQSIAFTKMVN